MFRQEFYPRHKPNSATLEQYPDALHDGAEFPPIEKDSSSNTPFDGTTSRFRAAAAIATKQAQLQLLPPSKNS